MCCVGWREGLREEGREGYEMKVTLDSIGGRKERLCRAEVLRKVLTGVVG